jgi:hypothetical protein
MVKLELVLTNDEAAIVWAAINTIREQKKDQRIAQTPAEPRSAQNPAEPRLAQTPAEPRAAEVTNETLRAPIRSEPRSAQTPAEPRSAYTPAEPCSVQTPAEPCAAEVTIETLRAPLRSEPPPAQTPAEPRSTNVTVAPSPPESPEERSTRRADAFMTIMHGHVRGERPQRTPVEIIVTVPQGSLRGSAEPSDLAKFSDGEVMAASTAQRLCCDAGVVVATVNDKGQPLSIGRKTRTIPPAIKRALLVRDQTCRFPGCHHRSFVDGHHIEHWANGGKTALSNLMLLCTAHHRLLHEGNFRVESDGADGWHFYDERNRRIVPRPARVTLQTCEPQRSYGIKRLRDDNAEFAISADSHASMWTGEKIDYGTCIDYLV